MATAKKGKKTSKPKKGGKSKKKSSKNNSLNAFSKIMLTLLLLAIFAGATFLILGNFNDDKNKEVQKKEISIKQDNDIKKQETKKETKPEAKKEDKPETKAKPEVKKESKKEETKQQVVEPKKEAKETRTLNGCWLSSEQGASLTMDDYGYRIDFFGVDASKPITGDYRIENNLIVFSSDGNECKGVEGSYRITFYKKNISLICKDDKCSSRRNILEADWEWMEI
ncbi:MAG: hypothetical protein IKU01_06685 [Bacteroidales bacterium]|nr:hypothetical protein [Bacteroidales bacterium]